jgi:hypothetical protein
MRAAAEYRKQAEECRRLAQQMAAPEDKRTLQELAETWEMLAKLHDRELIPENKASSILDLIKQHKSG